MTGVPALALPGRIAPADPAREASLPVPMGLPRLRDLDAADGPRLSIALMDGGGRLQDRAAVATLGWQPGDRLLITLVHTSVVIRRRPDGVFVMPRKPYVALPAPVRRGCGALAGSRMLLVADPVHDVLVVHPEAAVQACCAPSTPILDPPRRHHDRDHSGPRGGAAAALTPRRRPRRPHRRPAWVPAGEGKLYLCAVKDCYSNKIVGYSIASHMRASLAVAALRNAIALRDPCGTVVHSDRGAQFRSAAYRRLLRAHGLTGSMGRVGACGDNAAMESFFSLLQKNILDTRRWRTREELRLAIVTWIETKYHRKRRQRALGKLTPVEFGTIYTASAAA